MCTDIQFKIIYNSIQKYQGTSGFHWDNAMGETIVTPAEVNVWNEYVKIKVCCHCLILYHITYDYLYISI